MKPRTSRVEDRHPHPVPGADRRVAECQGPVDGVVELGPLADPPGHQPARIEGDHDGVIALVLIDPHHGPSPPGAGGPVEAPGIVAGNEVAEGFELHSLTAPASRLDPDRRENPLRIQGFGPQEAGRIGIDAEHVVGSADRAAPEQAER